MRLRSPLSLWTRLRSPFIVGLTVGWMVLALQFLGVLQPWELTTYDFLMQHRPWELPDERVVIVGLEQQDLEKLNTAVIPDQYVADLIQAVRRYQPRLIGLDLFRNLPIEPGHAELVQVLQQTPNLIGIEQVLDPAGIEPPPLIPGQATLVDSGRIAASDMQVDSDGVVRRGFFFPDARDHVISSLSLRLALDYLAAEEILPEPDAAVLTLNQVRFLPFNHHDGGYVHADQGGYQVLFNPRHTVTGFPYFTASQVLDQAITATDLRDRIVLIGSTIPAETDIFRTIYASTVRPFPRSGEPFQPTRQFMYGVEVHAHLTSQILSAVLDQRALIRVLPPWLESVLVLVTAVGIVLIYQQQRPNWQYPGWHHWFTAGSVLVAIALASYLLIVVGWWISPVPLILSGGATMAVMAELNSRQFKTLANRDELTQLANRRVFNRVLEQEWQRALRSHQPLALVLCDVDYFKRYNDTYGHLFGDRCLCQVAEALKSTARRSSDMVARYGGEEFVVLLPGADLKTAIDRAEQMAAAVRSRRIPHRTATDFAMVTISVGVTSLVPSLHYQPQDLSRFADEALYKAKANGRNCVQWVEPDAYFSPQQVVS